MLLFFVCALIDENTTKKKVIYTFALEKKNIYQFNKSRQRNSELDYLSHCHREIIVSEE